MIKQKFMVLDVETANSTDDALVYDIGFAICDRDGKIFDCASFIVTDIYDNEKDLMNTCYYAKKLPRYENGLKTGMFTKVSLYSARKIIKEYLNKYKITAVCAYNASFDTRALNTTERWITKSKYRWFLPYGTKIYCIWNMACQVICTQKGYAKYCYENNKISKSGNFMTSAETVYGYITKDVDFEESHTGFQDVCIEVAIMAHCFKQKKRMKKNINRCCWRIPQRKKEEI